MMLPEQDNNYQQASFKVLTGNQEQLNIQYIESPITYRIQKPSTPVALYDMMPHYVRLIGPASFTIILSTFNIFFPQKAAYLEQGYQYDGLTSFLEFVKRFAGQLLSFADDGNHTVLSPFVMITSSTYVVTQTTREINCGQNIIGMHKTTFETMQKL